MKRLFLFISFAVFLKTSFIWSQSEYYKSGHLVEQTLDRLDILYTSDHTFHHSVKNYSRERVFNYLRNVKTSNLKPLDSWDIQYLLKDSLLSNSINDNKGFWKSFYENPSHFYEYQNEDFSFVLNPVLYFRLGEDLENEEFIFQNTRGLELYGQLDQKFYFYTSLFENQSNFLNYIRPYISQYNAIPGQGNYKDYQSSLIDAFQGFDYSNAQAYLGYKLSKHAFLELGHGKHFIGNGQRSLLLSDDGQNYFYLKFKVEIWKLYYQSIFAELSSVSARYNPGNNILPKKYMASHYLGFKPNQKFEIGLFESVVFSRENHFEFQYLNPIIII